MTDNPELNLLRQEIDTVDDTILQQLVLRVNLVRQVANVKSTHSLEPLQPNRFNDLLHRLHDAAETQGLDPSLVDEVWGAIHSHSVTLQEFTIDQALTPRLLSDT